MGCAVVSPVRCAPPMAQPMGGVMSAVPRYSKRPTDGVMGRAMIGPLGYVHAPRAVPWAVP